MRNASINFVYADSIGVDTDFQTFLSSLDRLDRKAQHYLSSLHNCVVKAGKAIVYRKDTKYLAALLDRIACSDPIRIMKIKSYVSALCGGVVLDPATQEIAKIETSILAISKTADGHHTVSIKKSAKPQDFQRATDTLKVLGQKRFDTCALPRKAQVSESTLYTKSVDFLKALAKGLEDPERVGQLSALQRGQLTDLLGRMKDIFPGILD